MERVGNKSPAVHLQAAAEFFLLFLRFRFGTVGSVLVQISIRNRRFRFLRLVEPDLNRKFHCSRPVPGPNRPVASTTADLAYKRVPVRVFGLLDSPAHLVQSVHFTWIECVRVHHQTTVVLTNQSCTRSEQAQDFGGLVWNLSFLLILIPELCTLSLISPNKTFSLLTGILNVTIFHNSPLQLCRSHDTISFTLVFRICMDEHMHIRWKLIESQNMVEYRKQ